MRIETIAVLFHGSTCLGSTIFPGNHFSTLTLATAKTRFFPTADRAEISLRRFDPDGDFSVINTRALS